MPLIGDLADSLHVDAATFERGLNAAVGQLQKLQANVRPLCPTCQKPFAVLNTGVDEEFRKRYIGCRRCGIRHPIPEIIPASEAPKQPGPGWSPYGHYSINRRN